jgi:hypothetical protein
MIICYARPEYKHMFSRLSTVRGIHNRVRDFTLSQQCNCTQQLEDFTLYYFKLRVWVTDFMIHVHNIVKLRRKIPTDCYRIVLDTDWTQKSFSKLILAQVTA